MKRAGLRWLFLLAAVVGGVRCVLGTASLGCLALTLLCGGLWFVLSRRKVHSLDRETLGIPPRR
jgi:hypothetical protein